jgi:cell wall-associated NlpC family hydrolase
VCSLHATRGGASPGANEGILRRATIVFALTLATLAAVTPALGDPIGAKQAEARGIITRIDALGRRLDRASEAYNGATYRLRQIRGSLHRNELELVVARRDLRVAVHRLDVGLRNLYVTGTGDSTVEVLLGARSLDDVINGLDTRNRILQQAGQLAAAAMRYRANLGRVRERLQRTRIAQEQLVAERAAEKERILRGLAEQHRLLYSVQRQIAQLRHEEAVRQAELAAAAAARLAQQRAQEQQALRSEVVGATTQVPGANGAPPVTIVPPSQVGTRVVAIAEQYLGYPYVFGAAGPYSFDCSGLVTYVFAQVGISLPHFAAAQWSYGVPVAENTLEPGDLVFFADLDHVGIYIGSGEYIQAPHPGDVVKITPLGEPWSAANYYGARRIA